MTLEINDLYWHDGNFLGLSITEDSSIKIKLNLYPSESSANRVGISIVCEQIESLTSCIDFHSLMDNAKAGNITDGKLVKWKDSSKLKIFLTDGYLEVAAGTFYLATNKILGV